MAQREPTNAQVAAAFEELGDLYELDGAIVHRVVAYRAAAKAVREATVSVAGLARQGRATELKGIGKTLQEKIVDLAETGTIPAAERLRAKFPPGLVELTHLPGLGAKRARLLYDELGVDSVDALREAALAQRIRAVKGLGPKLEERILQALAEGREPPSSREPRAADPLAGGGGRGRARGGAGRARRARVRGAGRRLGAPARPTASRTSTWSPRAPLPRSWRTPSASSSRSRA